jgi:ParB-like chromosome segregation protein Spo0J
MLPAESIRLPTLLALAACRPSDAEIEACATALQANKEMAHPITVRPLAEGEYEVVDGLLRLLAA